MLNHYYNNNIHKNSFFSNTTAYAFYKIVRKLNSNYIFNIFYVTTDDDNEAPTFGIYYTVFVVIIVNKSLYLLQHAGLANDLFFTVVMAYVLCAIFLLYF